ncbi:ATP-dependent DNA/RNA helicase [Bacidia gigantensis]|uniref:ATP-dependent DNA/RNA helicase n=1 Tax=Bacidia gigantensis TaxID=2732470 RepID=UPI001D0596E3|nr:ATP-dependent DNA/RNA helicase [Bacidia gigantensis]KAG8531371.1 ATP-dependent DNA/RNA helicase [Bacidia gigantensis]
MKRKLDEKGVPSPVKGDIEASRNAGFESLGLDTRLLQAIAKEDFVGPTEVQAKAIPLALSGKDILARSKTGSGKTAAYALPVLQSILRKKGGDKNKKSVSALILVPTKELAQQITKAVTSLAAFCAQDVRTINSTQNVPEAVQRTQLAELPDIVVTTPSRAANHLNDGALTVESLTHLVVDEADLVLSYGYEEDFNVIAKAIPKGVQTTLMSATLTTEVDTLKGLFCRDPIVLDLKEKESDAGGVSQYVVRCSEDEKFLFAYVVFKLKLIKGKCIIFVADIDRCYRLKLFFEQFGIKSCILNSELPVNTRIHIVEEFNKDVYDIIIASDEHEALGQKTVSRKDDNDGLDRNGESATNGNAEEGEDDETSTKRRKRQKGSKKAKEYGISRGIDFRNVACVLNFDLPLSSNSYTHRIGRTARAGKSGMALSFAIPEDQYRKTKTLFVPSTRLDEKVLASITEDQKTKGKEVKPYNFDMKQVNVFKYRMNDALRAVSSVAIREARTRELKQELLKSEKLKRHFEENPQDLKNLKHDSDLRPARVQQHLKHIPDYLMPSGGAQAMVKDVGYVGLRKDGPENRIRRIRAMKRGRGGKNKQSGKGRNPLKTFRVGGKK